MTEIQFQQDSQVQRTYGLGFEELAIEPASVEDYIGFSPGMTPEPFPEIIDEINQVTGNFIFPRGGFVIFENIAVDRPGGKVFIEDEAFYTQSIISRHLQKSSRIALFVCTAGPEITQMAAEYNRKGNTIHAYLVDTLGTIIVERAMDLIHDHLKSMMKAYGFSITNRYSPGYCGWDIREQQKLFSILPQDFCGVHLSESMMMNPIKSVCGMIGIGKEVTFNPYACKFCNDISCLYRYRR
jgi:hypothetical protein